MSNVQPEWVERNLARCRELHVRAFRVAVNEFRCVSVRSRHYADPKRRVGLRHTARNWHTVRCYRLIDHAIQVVCDCESAMYRHDDRGGTYCVHSTAVRLRLIRNPQETIGIP